MKDLHGNQLGPGRTAYEFFLGTWRIMLTIVIAMAGYYFNQLNESIRESVNQQRTMMVDLAGMKASLSARIDAQDARILIIDNNILNTNIDLGKLKERVWTLLPRGEAGK